MKRVERPESGTVTIFSKQVPCLPLLASDLSLASLLKPYGVAHNRCTGSGASPRARKMAAAMAGQAECVQVLLEAQADFRLGTKWGTALSVAQDEGHREVAAVIRTHAADAAAAAEQQDKDTVAAAASVDGEGSPHQAV